MATLASMWDQLKGFNVEQRLGLRPNYPDVVLQLGPSGIAAVRVKRGRGAPTLEAHQLQALDEPVVPSGMLQVVPTQPDRLGAGLLDAMQRVGAKPGRVSVVLPDNVAKISLLPLPERPASRKQLDEIVNFKMRRALPFRMSEAVVSYQVLPAEGSGVSVLVALVRRTLIEQYETALHLAGCRPGLIDLATPSLLNLCREQVSEAPGDDVALLNCDHAYFSLVIVRDGRMIFYRCKSYPLDEEQQPMSGNGLLRREIAGSLSYYEEKLDGKGIGTLLVRSVGEPPSELIERIEPVAIDSLRSIELAAELQMSNGRRIDDETAHGLAPALGAAVGRS